MKSCLGCKHELGSITAEPCFNCCRVNSQSFDDYFEERNKDDEDNIKFNV